jgi:hypothetical protein
VHLLRLHAEVKVLRAATRAAARGHLALTPGSEELLRWEQYVSKTEGFLHRHSAYGNDQQALLAVLYPLVIGLHKDEFAALEQNLLDVRRRTRTALAEARFGAPGKYRLI